MEAGLCACKTVRECGAVRTVMGGRAEGNHLRDTLCAKPLIHSVLVPRCSQIHHDSLDEQVGVDTI